LGNGDGHKSVYILLWKPHLMKKSLHNDD